MVGIFTKEKRSDIMSRIKSGSGIERLLKKFRGLYFRKHPKMLSNPDFGNKSKGIVVFIDGCFWHSCPMYYREPDSRPNYWVPKIMYNILNDLAVTYTLEKEGFEVIRIWECEADDR